MRHLLSLVLTFVLLVAPACGAVMVTFSLTDPPGTIDDQSTFAVLSGGVTATFSNPTFETNPTDFDADTDGTAMFGDGAFATIDAFEISFDQEVTLVSYNVGFRQGTFNSNETLTFSNGGNSSVQSEAGGDFSLGSHNFSNQFTIPSSQTLTVSAAGIDNSGVNTEFVQFDSVTVMVVPEPMVSLLFLMGVGACSLRRRRTRD